MQVIVVDHALRAWMERPGIPDGKPRSQLLKVHRLNQNPRMCNPNNTISEAQSLAVMRAILQWGHNNFANSTVYHALE
jgi:hypothetical protein